jgi:hypothetical protein
MLTPASPSFVKFFVAHAAFGHLLPIRCKDFIDGWTGDGLLNKSRRKRRDILAALSGALGQLGAGFVGKAKG